MKPHSRRCRPRCLRRIGSHHRGGRTIIRGAQWSVARAGLPRMRGTSVSLAPSELGRRSRALLAGTPREVCSVRLLRVITLGRFLRRTAVESCDFDDLDGADRERRCRHELRAAGVPLMGSDNGGGVRARCCEVDQVLSAPRVCGRACPVSDSRSLISSCRAAMAAYGRAAAMSSRTRTAGWPSRVSDGLVVPAAVAVVTGPHRSRLRWRLLEVRLRCVTGSAQEVEPHCGALSVRQSHR